jgi:hypothetical protein
MAASSGWYVAVPPDTPHHEEGDDQDEDDADPGHEGQAGLGRYEHVELDRLRSGTHGEAAHHGHLGLGHGHDRGANGGHPGCGVPRPYCAGRSAYWRAMCMRSSASESSVSFPLTSTVTLWMVPVNLNGLA